MKHTFIILLVLILVCVGTTGEVVKLLSLVPACAASEVAIGKLLYDFKGVHDISYVVAYNSWKELERVPCKESAYLVDACLNLLTLRTPNYADCACFCKTNDHQHCTFYHIQNKKTGVKKHFLPSGGTPASACRTYGSSQDWVDYAAYYRKYMDIGQDPLRSAIEQKMKLYKNKCSEDRVASYLRTRWKKKEDYSVSKVCHTTTSETLPCTISFGELGKFDDSDSDIESSSVGDRKSTTRSSSDDRKSQVGSQTMLPSNEATSLSNEAKQSTVKTKSFCEYVCTIL
jgi:hypothetical protein